MGMKIDWSLFKTIVDSEELSIHYVEYNDHYHLHAYNGVTEVINCELLKIHEDCTVFEQTYKALANKPLINKMHPFSDAAGFRFRGASFTGTCLTNTTSNIDYEITQDRYINGGRLIINNIGTDDKISFQVIDKNNVMGFGSNVVLDEFITDFYIPQDGSLEVSLDYPAKILAGLFIRLVYSCSHASGCTIKCNLYLHWKSV